MRSIRLTVPLALAAVLAGTLAGCQTTDRDLAWDYGKAYHTVFENQKIDPAAGDDSPITSMDGTRAALAYERLEKTAPDEKKQNVGGFEAFMQQKN
ncbi:hypothetical protein [Solidesulfovibrio sp.]